jgi:hypothetical protein
MEGTIFRIPGNRIGVHAEIFGRYAKSPRRFGRLAEESAGGALEFGRHPFVGHLDEPRTS